MPNLLPIVKTAAVCVTSMSASAVVKGVILNNLAEPETTREKVELTVGCIGIGMVVGNVVGSTVENYVDTVATMFKKDQAPSEEPTEIVE